MFLFQGAFSAKKIQPWPILFGFSGDKVAVEGFREGWVRGLSAKKGMDKGRNLTALIYRGVKK